jgi:hypothetical protein
MTQKDKKLEDETREYLKNKPNPQDYLKGYNKAFEEVEKMIDEIKGEVIQEDIGEYTKLIDVHDLKQELQKLKEKKEK